MAAMVVRNRRTGRLSGAVFGLLLVVSVVNGSLISTAVAAPGSPITAAFVSSEPGDFVGGGANYSFSDITYDLQNGGVVFTATNSSTTFYFTFLPAVGQTLVPGTYLVSGVPNQGPQLDISGNSHGCDNQTGWFTIDDATYDGSGNILSFSVRFEQHCGVDEAALFGALSYQSTAPYRTRTISPSAATFTSPDGGPVAQTISITNNGPSTLSPSYTIAGANPGDFQVTATTCRSSLAAKATCTYTVTYTPGIAETSAATFEYFDELSPAGSARRTSGRGNRMAHSTVGDQHGLPGISAGMGSGLYRQRTGQRFGSTTGGSVHVRNLPRFTGRIPEL